MLYFRVLIVKLYERHNLRCCYETKSVIEKCKLNFYFNVYKKTMNTASRQNKMLPIKGKLSSFIVDHTVFLQWIPCSSPNTAITVSHISNYATLSVCSSSCMLYQQLLHTTPYSHQHQWHILKQAEHQQDISIIQYHITDKGANHFDHTSQSTQEEYIATAGAVVSMTLGVWGTPKSASLQQMVASIYIQ